MIVTHSCYAWDWLSHTQAAHIAAAAAAAAAAVPVEPEGQGGGGGGGVLDMAYTILGEGFYRYPISMLFKA